MARRLGLRSRLVTQAETHTIALGHLRRVLVRVALWTVVIEVGVALAPTLRVWVRYDYPLPKALWFGTFHAVSGFNHTGYSLFSDNLVGFVGDWWINLPRWATGSRT